MWKNNWIEAQNNLIKWWHGEGLAIHLCAERQSRNAALIKPVDPANWEMLWTDPLYRLPQAEFEMAHTDYLAEAFPYFDTQIGPGSLGTFIGSEPNFAPDTVWYEACIADPESYGAIMFDLDNNRWWKVHLALIEAGLKHAGGNYLVGMPDLIENIDTLAQLRGPGALLFDLIEKPAWVHQHLAELNEIYFEAFSRIYSLIKDDTGGNAFAAFQIWGPGKTAKIQCDFSAMISPTMFRTFVQPYLEQQCQWLDFSLYHLDGTNALQHVDNLLSIDALNAIEWTPQAGKPGGGSPEWFDLYHRIKAGGKSLQAIGVAPDEVIPLLDAVGPKGTMILLDRKLGQNHADALVKQLEPYYPG